MRFELLKLQPWIAVLVGQQYCHRCQTLTSCLLVMRLQKEVFPYCPAWVLSWHYRKQVLLMELRRYNADILCLQARSAAALELYSVVGGRCACTGPSGARCGQPWVLVRDSDSCIPAEMFSFSILHCCGRSSVVIKG